MNTVVPAPSSPPLASSTPVAARRLGENCLIALVLLGIGVAHVVGVTVLLSAAITNERQVAILVVHGD